jgi:hypothetical protein
MALCTGQATGWPSPGGGRGNNQLRMAYGQSASARLTVGCRSLAAGSGRIYSVRWSIGPLAEQRSAGTSASAPSEPADRDLCLLSLPTQQAGDGMPSMLAHGSGAVEMPAFRAQGGSSDRSPPRRVPERKRGSSGVAGECFAPIWRSCCQVGGADLLPPSVRCWLGDAVVGVMWLRLAGRSGRAGVRDVRSEAATCDQRAKCCYQARGAVRARSRQTSVTSLLAGRLLAPRRSRPSGRSRSEDDLIGTHAARRALQDKAEQTFWRAAASGGSWSSCRPCGLLSAACRAARARA